MLRTNRALALSATVTVLGWFTAGAATSWVILNPPTLTYPAIYLLWLHSFAIVATMFTVVIVAARTFQRIIGEATQAYALGLEQGMDIRSSITAPSCEVLDDSAPSSPETREAPASAGASPMTVR
ncbi:hypothetical protein E1286_38775 [Nonomuraea terrae]|uniref:Uncharacterized protein n=1 Tax=Nonomuraea terrae TaxID=2530383 RepID=A0A4R4XX84_9ACTN|nr:hypothetical protein [Nonomuraea terrae]TDD36113.1 hypothetical protein E1286_38775 [Nonomuraea terrae]